MPQYSQYGGACGLTSLLMALKPESRGFADLLDDIAGNVDVIEPSGDRGRDWQQAIEYLLTEIPRKDVLKQIMEEDYGDDFTGAMLPVLEHDLGGDASKRDHDWLMHRVNVWKKNSELSMISSLFGCKFEPFPGSADGTGSISFNPSDPPELICQKRELIGDRVNSYEDPVLCCNHIHWIAVKEVDDDDIVYHDPAGGWVRQHGMDNFFSGSQKFYGFKCSADRWKRNEGIIRDAVLGGGGGPRESL